MNFLSFKNNICITKNLKQGNNILQSQLLFKMSINVKSSFSFQYKCVVGCENWIWRFCSLISKKMENCLNLCELWDYLLEK
jgi:hypothetical protein